MTRPMLTLLLDMLLTMLALSNRTLSNLRQQERLKLASILSPPKGQAQLLWLRRCKYSAAGFTHVRVLEELTRTFSPLNRDSTKELCNNYCIESRENSRSDLLRAIANLREVEGHTLVFRNILEHEEQGIKLLLRLRSDLIREIKHSKFKTSEEQQNRKENALKALNTDLSDLIRPLFGEASLMLERISLASQGVLIEKLMQYEKVHPYMGLEDVKRRLGSGYRCFGLFHPRLYGEPLAFVHVALVAEMAPSMQYIRESQVSEDDATTAVFYTISSSEEGLAGFELGNQLIKRVVSELTKEFPQLQVFSTLSPVPNFTQWLKLFLAQNGELDIKHDRILNTLQLPRWYKDEKACELIREPIMELCKLYLLEKTQADGFSPLCPVENFHIKNGAALARINWAADLTRNGIEKSAGIMINYHYRLEQIQSNMKNYFVALKDRTRKNYTIPNDLEQS